MSIRSQIKAALLASAAALGLVGVVVTNTPGTPAHAVCTGGTCMALLQPKAGQCAALMATGGEPPGTQTVSVGTRTARALEGIRENDPPGLMLWHAFSAAGATDGCGVTVWLTRVQAAAWRDVVDAAGVGSILADPRLATAPAWAKNGAGHANVLAGQNPAADAEADPDAGADGQ